MSSDPALTYRESAGQTASPVRLVILLYEQLIKDLQRAAVAIERNQVEARTQEIDHALIVVAQLQGVLDMERGGDVAKNLDRFYDVLRGSLIEAEIRRSADLLHAQVRHLLTLREAWVEVELANAGKRAPLQRTPAASSIAAADCDNLQRADWKV